MICILLRIQTAVYWMYTFAPNCTLQQQVLLVQPPLDRELVTFSWMTWLVLAVRPHYLTASTGEWAVTTVVTLRMLEPCVQAQVSAPILHVQLVG